MSKAKQIIVNFVLYAILLFCFSCQEQISEEEGTLSLSSVALECKKLPTIEVLSRGASLHGANGIRFDSNNKLYVAAVANDEIVVINRKNGKILRRYGLDQGVVGPDDIAFGPDGSMYWTSFTSGAVGKIAPDGTYSSQMIGAGLNAIAFSADGRLFVTLVMMSDALYEVDPQLQNPPRLVAENLGFLNAMDWGTDGYLYGPIMTMGQVVRVDPNSGNVTPVATGFAVPVAAKFGPGGRLYVVDSMTGLVSRINISNGNVSNIAQLEPGLDNLAFDSNGRLFVSNGPDGSVVEIVRDGSIRTVSKGGMILPGGIAIYPDNLKNKLYVADLFSLREFRRLTGEATGVDRNLLGFTPLTVPQTVAVDGSNLLLTSWFMNEVQIWNPNEHQVVATYKDFAVPMNAIRFQGDLIVVELGTSSVVRANGADPSIREPIAQGLGVPIGLAATDNAVWVSDWAAGMVFQIIANGQPLETPIPVAMGLANPEGLAVGGDGNLLVVEEGAKRLSKINLTTGAVTTIADNLAIGLPPSPGTPPTGIFNGVAAMKSGKKEHIYVTGEVSNVIYHITNKL